ncbi:MAG TPA: cysteine--tRNA ligase [Candidatus Moranbacteria bacterium]|nr:cysteine--tRNA ligase [Candidatus Moranbacteria bacterium]HAT74864.1 cysteine--tRNA ligase [Candidatus Moranbacteria bacterium]
MAVKKIIMLRLYNTLSKTKEEFKPIDPGKVGMYNCGPTVYDYAHIGNLNAFLVADILRRQLEYNGYEVRQIMNITDVGHLTADDVNQADTGEDKMLKAVKRENKTPADIADFYTEKFFEDLKKLNIKKAAYYPRATAHIPQMIKIISGLIERGLAYEINGNVFYDIAKFSGYGKLSGKKIEDLKVGARLEEHPDKKNPWDFALWLKAPKEHILKWKSPWSLGYPGWHIECSAMSMEYLGETLDIHTGGEDHIFPHHENEIAQSEGFTGKKFSNYWLHNRFLLIDGAKMSKSKGNFYALKDIEEKGYIPMTFRLLILGSHYRSNLNFTENGIEQAKNNFKKISDWINNLENISQNIENPLPAEIDFSYIYLKRFEEAMNDDLNTPLALSVLYELITETNKLLTENKLGEKNAKNILVFWKKINKVFGLIIEKNITEIPAEISALAKERKIIRENKDFKKSDELREKIEKRGYTVEDLKNNNYLIKKL